MGTRKGIQLCYPFEEKRLLTWQPPYVVQPKLDGERCRALLNCGQVVMLSSEENIITSVPKIHSDLVKLSIRLGKPIELDGELFREGMDFEEIHSVVGRTVNLNPDHVHIKFNVFDIINEDIQAVRVKQLTEISGIFPETVVMVPSKIAFTVEDVKRVYDLYINLGYEGIIVRHFSSNYIRRRSIFVMKFKPKKKDIYPIIGFVEGQGKYAGTIGAIVCETDGDQFEVGSFSLTDEERNELWNKRFELTNFNCKVGYQHRWKSGKPKSGVFIELAEKTPEVKFNNPLEGL